MIITEGPEVVVFESKIRFIAGTVRILTKHNEQGLAEVTAVKKMEQDVQITVKSKKRNKQDKVKTRKEIRQVMRISDKKSAEESAWWTMLKKINISRHLLDFVIQLQ